MNNNINSLPFQLVVSKNFKYKKQFYAIAGTIENYIIYRNGIKIRHPRKEIKDIALWWLQEEKKNLLNTMINKFSKFMEIENLTYEELKEKEEIKSFLTKLSSINLTKFEKELEDNVLKNIKKEIKLKTSKNKLNDILLEWIGYKNYKIYNYKIKDLRLLVRLYIMRLYEKCNF